MAEPPSKVKRSRPPAPSKRGPKSAKKSPATTSRQMTVRRPAKSKSKKRRKKIKPLDPFRLECIVPYLVAMFILMIVVLLGRSCYLPDQQEEVVAVTIEAGMSATMVSELLYDHRVVDSAPNFLQFLVSSELTTKVKSGTFVLPLGASYEEIARTISSTGQQVSLTVHPASTHSRIDAYIDRRLDVGEGAFLHAAHDLAQAYHLSFTEGWLLSGVYEVTTQRAAAELVMQMYKAMLEEVSRHLSSPLLARYSVDQLLIIASLIQAETQNISEMAQISAVIHNRLAIDEPLGIDATTRYELDDWINPIPTKALETQTPYNTRRKRGLPPTGICAPSPEAVEAAFFPAHSDALFYLHGVDGTIRFALDYEEHKRNIERYR